MALPTWTVQRPEGHEGWRNWLWPLAICAVWGVAFPGMSAASGNAPADALAIITNLHDTETGSDARGPLVVGSDGWLYGVATYAGPRSGGTLFRVSTAGSFEVLHAFAANSNELWTPIGSPTQLSDGSWVGTTCDGGLGGGGGVYRYTHEAGLQRLAWFRRSDLPDGPSCSYAALLPASDGRLYGTSAGGGRHGEGTVFSLRPDGSDLRIHHHFKGGEADAAGVTAPLIQASDGFLYGTSTRGGVYDLGTVFRLRPGSRRLEVLHFMTWDEGTAPWGPLLQASDGGLYGINQTYGSSNTDPDRGTAFKVGRKGHTYRVVNYFGDSFDSPRLSSAGFVELPDGSLWSTSSYGGQFLNGAIFRVLPDGSRQTMHSFDGRGGGAPAGAPVLAPDGYLYGTTSYGGTWLYSGTIYRMNPQAGAAAPRIEPSASHAGH